jgi:hypothetical protein
VRQALPAEKRIRASVLSTMPAEIQGSPATGKAPGRTDPGRGRQHSGASVHVRGGGVAVLSRRQRAISASTDGRRCVRS